LSIFFFFASCITATLINCNSSDRLTSWDFNHQSIVQDAVDHYRAVFGLSLQTQVAVFSATSYEVNGEFFEVPQQEIPNPDTYLMENFLNHNSRVLLLGKMALLTFPFLFFSFFFAFSTCVCCACQDILGFMSVHG
jgi:hypothetical protein